jgi:hypothetical protein
MVRHSSMVSALAGLLLGLAGLAGCGGETECSCEADCGPGERITIYLDSWPHRADVAVNEDVEDSDTVGSEDAAPLPDAADDVVEDLAEEVEGPSCPLGTACNPIPVPALPFHDERDGQLGPGDDWDWYSPCAPDINESGPEWVYRLEIAEAGVLHVTLDQSLESDIVDMDVHILSAPESTACVARGHYDAAHYVEPGTWWVVVDTWVNGEGVEHAGPFAVDIHLTQGSVLPEEAGFNQYVVEAINDWAMYPKDGTYFFCYQNPSCEPDWVDIYFGMIHDTGYLGEILFEGTGRCYCCGHTLEVFLDAYRRYQLDKGLPVTVPYGGLTLDDVDIGPFYQHWFGFGVAKTSSSANALEDAGIGMNLLPSEWEMAVTGDFMNISRSNGTGHAVIFVDWVRQGDEIVGIRYYGCNSSGDSHPDPDHPDNQSGVSGPSFVTEYFTDHGGKVLTGYVFIGRAFPPDQL